MHFTKIAITIFLTQLILGCASIAGDAKFNSSEIGTSHQSPMASMKVLIEVAVIGAIGRPDTKGISIVQTYNDANQALVNAFNTKMKEAGVTAIVKSFGSVKMTKTATWSETKTERVGLEKMIASENSSAEPLLVIQIGSSEADNTVWNGRVGWSLNLVDPTVWTIKNQTAIWKGTTELTQFGPLACQVDAYKACADKFADSVIAQLRTEKLIK